MQKAGGDGLIWEENRVVTVHYVDKPDKRREYNGALKAEALRTVRNGRSTLPFVRALDINSNQPVADHEGRRIYSGHLVFS